MIVVLNPGASPERTQHLIHWLEEQNLGVHVSKGEYQTVLGLIGNTSKVDMEMLQSLDIVDSVTRVSDPFKAVNRKFHPDDSTIVAGPASIGGGHFGLIAGPCSVETEEQIIYVAQQVKAAGANFLGAVRSSPVLPPMTSRAWVPRASACCWRPKRPPACPLSPRSWTSATCLCSRRWT